ncbi:MAG: 4-hydroxy-3-methylbut-2-enyl diphosphate reductase [Thiotrichales bacterium]|nr:4-hydroxy-3-methylbut-2-enyl diphosphate reductase [Thiotrichales bacterium]MBT4152708.1 4-hydroxy-3-methylbut-2-enyl diphosphate reductase [Thiotrichales bacterium]MBT4262146.1 4-hydroxy-3-methylbut-2-enyl diphosphate reductase [Thiotrichales bacterium]MBT4574041.1 4-hydroxy-3-methylbut-2-enyl diphosphate reductase [Thiotrichales bacterium]MBT5419038.1 4-hydroxy-3-methylbut-2-enyl diphosphate reductase [Thiotrichales bacterium]
MKIELAQPRGFCAGVERAITIVERALELFGAPIFVRHEVVHNRYVVERLRKLGAIFVQELDEVPAGAKVIFSAHGVSEKVEQNAATRNLTVFDATCPLVTKVHKQVARDGGAGRDVVLIGHAGHPEVEGTLGRYPTDSKGGDIYLVENVEEVGDLKIELTESISYATQTTLSMDDAAEVVSALKERFPALRRVKKDDICYATQNRQNAVKLLAENCKVVLVVGSSNSSNSNRLREIAEELGVAAYLIDHAQELKSEWFSGVESVGVTAGASAPENLVEGVMERLMEFGGEWNGKVSGEIESVFFPLPEELR